MNQKFQKEILIPEDGAERNNKIEAAFNFLTKGFTEGFTDIGKKEKREKEWKETSDFMTAATPEEFSAVCKKYFNYQAGAGIRLYENDKIKRQGPIEEFLIKPFLADERKKSVFLTALFNFFPSDKELSSEIFLKIGDILRSRDKSEYLDYCVQLINAGEEEKIKPVDVIDALTAKRRSGDRNFGLGAENLLRIGLWNHELALKLVRLGIKQLSPSACERISPFYLADRIAILGGALKTKEFISYWKQTEETLMDLVKNADDITAEDIDEQFAYLYKNLIRSVQLVKTFSEMKDFFTNLQTMAQNLKKNIASSRGGNISFPHLEKIEEEMEFYAAHCENAELADLSNMEKGEGVKGKIRDRRFNNYLDLLSLSKRELEGKVILDLGAGKGRFANESMKEVPSAKIISLEPFTSGQSQKLFMVGGKAEFLPLKNISFDKIVSVYAIPSYSRSFDELSLQLNEIKLYSKKEGEARLSPFSFLHAEVGGNSDFYNWSAFEKYLEKNGWQSRIEIGEDTGGFMSLGGASVRALILKKKKD